MTDYYPTCLSSHPEGERFYGEGAGRTQTKSAQTARRRRFYIERLFLLHPQRSWEYCGGRGTQLVTISLYAVRKWQFHGFPLSSYLFPLGDPTVLVRGAGVLELTDPHQQQLPLHQPEADAGVRPRRLCEILHPHAAQVGRLTLTSEPPLACLHVFEIRKWAVE